MIMPVDPGRFQVLDGHEWESRLPKKEASSPVYQVGFGETGVVDNPLFKFCLLIYYFVYWVFVAAHRPSLVAANQGYSFFWCTGISFWWFLLLTSTESRHVSFSSCGTQAQELQLMGPRAWAQQLPHVGLLALRHAGFSWIKN